MRMSGGWNPPLIPLYRKCYLCLRYEVLPMCAGKTLKSMAPPAGLEPATR